jgi:hypothetical protein
VILVVCAQLAKWATLEKVQVYKKKKLFSKGLQVQRA